MNEWTIYYSQQENTAFLLKTFLVDLDTSFKPNYLFCIDQH